jgi:hypothetical protein
MDGELCFIKTWIVTKLNYLYGRLCIIDDLISIQVEFGNPEKGSAIFYLEPLESDQTMAPHVVLFMVYTLLICIRVIYTEF